MIPSATKMTIHDSCIIVSDVLIAIYIATI